SRKARTSSNYRNCGQPTPAHTHMRCSRGCREVAVREHGRVSALPSLHHRKEGWLRHQEKCRAATEADAAGVVFLLHPSENHPGLAISGASRYFLDRSTTPPCGDARRGVASSQKI